jgi:hypothetical protein
MWLLIHSFVWLCKCNKKFKNHLLVSLPQRLSRLFYIPLILQMGEFYWFNCMFSWKERIHMLRWPVPTSKEIKTYHKILFYWRSVRYIFFEVFGSEGAIFCIKTNWIFKQSKLFESVQHVVCGWASFSTLF